MGIIVATVFSFVAGFDVIQLSVPTNMFSEVSLPSSAWGALLIDRSIWISAMVIAIVGSAATLLTAAAVDEMTRDIGVKTDFDRELTGQGVGNVLCGLVGALPMTGVIVRSSANVHAGARTRKSTVLHGAWLLLFVCFLPQLLSYIPKSALGALLGFHRVQAVKPKAVERAMECRKGGGSDLPYDACAHRFRGLIGGSHRWHRVIGGEIVAPVQPPGRSDGW